MGAARPQLAGSSSDNKAGACHNSPPYLRRVLPHILHDGVPALRPRRPPLAAAARRAARRTTRLRGRGLCRGLCRGGGGLLALLALLVGQRVLRCPLVFLQVAQRAQRVAQQQVTHGQRQRGIGVAVAALRGGGAGGSSEHGGQCSAAPSAAMLKHATRPPRAALQQGSSPMKQPAPAELCGTACARSSPAAAAAPQSRPPGGPARRAAGAGRGWGSAQAGRRLGARRQQRKSWQPCMSGGRRRLQSTVTTPGAHLQQAWVVPAAGRAAAGTTHIESGWANGEQGSRSGHAAARQARTRGSAAPSRWPPAPPNRRARTARSWSACGCGGQSHAKRLAAAIASCAGRQSVPWTKKTKPLRVPTWAPRAPCSRASARGAGPAAARWRARPPSRAAWPPPAPAARTGLGPAAPAAGGGGGGCGAGGALSRRGVLQKGVPPAPHRPRAAAACSTAANLGACSRQPSFRGL